MEILYAKVVDQGRQRGAMLVTFSDYAPMVCPGLGGWKKGAGISWQTGVHGPVATALVHRTRAVKNPWVALRVNDHGGIVEVAQKRDAVNDADLEGAFDEGRLQFRSL